MVKRIKQSPQVDRYRMMRLILTVEVQLSRLFADSEVPGFILLSIGQEAIAAGVMAEIDEPDTMATNHRRHGHVIARGIDMAMFFMEIIGKFSGVLVHGPCRSRVCR